MQVYRGMDIGTAKPDAAFLSTLPHHLIDICDPREQFCAGDFVRLADEACADIHSRGRLPVVLGGTAFYIRNFLYGLPETPESDPAVRSHLQERMKAEGAAALKRELAAVDPVSAERINIHDEYRILRALEVYAASGRPLSSYGLSVSFRAGRRFLALSLDRPREVLYERIDRRVDQMFASGLVDEFVSLVRSGCGPGDPGLQAIGYREFFQACGEGGIPRDVADLERVIELVKTDSRKYAKRQETFIRSIPEIRHFSADDIGAVYREIMVFYEGCGAARGLDCL
jgi:tRNA dimethylallyltransferase